MISVTIHTNEFNRPTNKVTVENKGQGNQNAGKSLEVGIADDQAKDFDFEKTEMKYDSTGMFHWTPARSIEDCILDRNQVTHVCFFTNYVLMWWKKCRDNKHN